MKPEVLVRQFLGRKKEAQSGYSLRALARDIKVSPSFLSEVMTGKKKMPVKWIGPIARILSLDEIAISDLKLSVLHSHIEGTDLEKLLDGNHTKAYSKVSLSKPLDWKKNSLLNKWYYVAVLDFLTLENASTTVKEMAMRLELNPAAIREALSALKDLNLITIDENGLAKKTNQHIRIPTSKTHPIVRGFHVQMIEKAKHELLRNTNDDDFQRRLIAGTTMAVNPKYTEKIKQKLQAFMADIAREFSDGKAKEIYQLNLQLFPLTKNSAFELSREK